MKHYFSLIALLSFIFCSKTAISKDRHRFLIVLDGTLSMANPWAVNSTKYEAASTFITILADSAYNVDSNIEFGLFVFGHQYPATVANCYDAKQEVFFSRDNREQLKMRIGNIRPKGFSSALYALQQAVTSADKKSGYDYHYILITDGNKSCNANFCSKFENTFGLKNLDIRLIRFSAEKEEQSQCVDKFLNLSNEAQMSAAITNLLDPFRKLPTHNSIPQLTPTTSKADTISGYGYLLISDIKNSEINSLYYKEGNQYVPFSKLNIANLKKGQRIRLQNGFYRIEYRAALIGKRAKEFEIINNMITEIVIK